MYQELINQIILQDCHQFAINVSGGKDSQAMLSFMLREYPKANKFCIFADLGRAEWVQTRQFVIDLCLKKEIELQIVKANKDLIDFFLQRYHNLKAKNEHKVKPFWADSKNRYCTSQSKIAPINKYLRRFNLIVNCIGIRAKESENRANKNFFKIRKDISAKMFHELSPEKAFELWLKNQSKRLVFDFLPIFDWDLERVWQEDGHGTNDWEKRRKMTNDADSIKGWNYHSAYVIGTGNTRLSCAFCILGSINDLQNAIDYNPETYQILTNLEKELGWNFQSKRSLSSVKNRPKQLELNFY